MHQRSTRLLVACLLAVAGFAAYHFYLRGLMLDTGLRLGAVRPGQKVYRIVPLYIYWRPRLKTGVLIAMIVIGAFIWWLRRVILAGESQAAGNGAFSVAGAESKRCPGSDSPGHRLGSATSHRFIAALLVWHIAISISVALIDGGPHKLSEPYRVHHRSDYIGAVARIDSPREFLLDYPRLMPQLPLHCRHHPPGGPLLLWAIARVFGSGAGAASVATILISALAAPAVYLLAGDVLDEAPARLAAALFMLAPNVVCYSATCMDAVFMTPLVWSFFFLWHGRRGRPLMYGAAAGLTGSVASMMTFSTSFVALWSIVLLGLTAAFDRRRLLSTCLTLLAAIITAALFYALLYAWSSYDALAVLRQAFAGQAEVMKGRGHSSLRQSMHFTITNLVAFMFCSGLPIVVLWICQTARERVAATASEARWLLLSFAITLFCIDLAPLYTLETERIWIFLVGFLAIAAAARLSHEGNSLSSPIVTATLLLQAGQTVLMEVFFEWVW